MDMLDIASGHLDFGPGFGSNSDIKPDYGGKKSKLNTFSDINWDEIYIFVSSINVKVTFAYALWGSLNSN